jgi:hypothetical protein
MLKVGDLMGIRRYESRKPTTMPVVIYSTNLLAGNATFFTLFMDS